MAKLEHTKIYRGGVTAPNLTIDTSNVRSTVPRSQTRSFSNSLQRPEGCRATRRLARAAWSKNSKSSKSLSRKNTTKHPHVGWLLRRALVNTSDQILRCYPYVWPLSPNNLRGRNRPPVSYSDPAVAGFADCPYRRLREDSCTWQRIRGVSKKRVSHAKCKQT